MTPEQREKQRENRRRRAANMTPEQREKKREKDRRRRENMTPEQRRDERRRLVAAINAFAIVPPRTPWSPEEDETLLSWSGTVPDLAIHLGRTYSSTHHRRRELLARHPELF